MKKKRFASYLLAGKAATLPFAINSSHADVMPSYTDVMTGKATLIEQPAPGVKLLTISTSASSGSTYGGSTYGGSTYSGGDAAVCNAPLPAIMNVVVTGVKPGDNIYLVAASDKDAALMLAYDSRLRIGTTNQTVIAAFRISSSNLGGEESAMAGSISSVSIPVDMNKLQAKGLLTSGKFYLQAAMFPVLSGTGVFTQARFTELDEVSVSTAGCSTTYGSTYGSTY